jgi:RUNX transcription factor Runt
MMHLHNGISQKINSSFDMNSTAEQSSEESDEEHIDVVKSAFVPILRPHHQSPPSSVLSPANIVKLEKADSTVRDQLSPDLPPKSRNDSKAPQLKKHSIVHETAPTGRIRSPETILKITATVQKTVWRPYWKYVVVTHQNVKLFSTFKTKTKNHQKLKVWCSGAVYKT